MQRKRRTIKSNYFNTYSQSAKLYSAIIILYCLIFCLSCREKSAASEFLSKSQPPTVENSININTASAAELEKLPAVGEEFARRIIEHREKFGRFRRAEHLLLVRGMSDKKFRQIKNLVTVR